MIKSTIFITAPHPTHRERSCPFVQHTIFHTQPFLTASQPHVRIRWVAHYHYCTHYNSNSNHPSIDAALSLDHPPPKGKPLQKVIATTMLAYSPAPSSFSVCCVGFYYIFQIYIIHHSHSPSGIIINVIIMLPASSSSAGKSSSLLHHRCSAFSWPICWHPKPRKNHWSK